MSQKVLLVMLPMMLCACQLEKTALSQPAEETQQNSSSPAQEKMHLETSAEGNILLATDANFDESVLKSQGVFLVDFYADWCPPCKMQGPIVEQIAQEMSGKMKVGKVNVDQNPGLSARYQIRGIPTLILFKNGQLIEKLVGYHTKEQLMDKIQAQLK